MDYIELRGYSRVKSLQKSGKLIEHGVCMSMIMNQTELLKNTGEVVVVAIHLYFNK